MCLALLSRILEDTKKGYRLSQSSVLINHLVHMDDVKLYSRSKREIESLVYTLSIFFKDICMDIGTSKCNGVAVSKDKVVDSGNISLPSGEVINQLLPSEVYKYLGILECDTVKNQLIPRNTSDV